MDDGDGLNGIHQMMVKITMSPGTGFCFSRRINEIELWHGSCCLMVIQ